MTEKEAVTLTRKDYEGALEQVAAASGNNDSYLAGFTFAFPEGMNTASTLEICRMVNEQSFDMRVRLARICIAGKPVAVTCPNGDIEKFRMTNIDDSFDGLPLFEKEPLALIALTDCVYGYIVKKSVRLSAPDGAAVQRMR